MGESVGAILRVSASAYSFSLLFHEERKQGGLDELSEEYLLEDRLVFLNDFDLVSQTLPEPSLKDRAHWKVRS